jgi:hypothetical protein
MRHGSLSAIGFSDARSRARPSCKHPSRNPRARRRRRLRPARIWCVDTRRPTLIKDRTPVRKSWIAMNRLCVCDVVWLAKLSSQKKRQVSNSAKWVKSLPTHFSVPEDLFDRRNLGPYSDHKFFQHIALLNSFWSRRTFRTSSTCPAAWPNLVPNASVMAEKPLFGSYSFLD